MSGSPSKTIPISDWQHAELQRIVKMAAAKWRETPERAERAVVHQVIMKGLAATKADVLGEVTQ